METRLHNHLRLSVMIGWLMLWNVLLGAAIWLNDGLGHMHSVAGGWLMFAALEGSAFFALCVLLVPSIQAATLRPNKQISAIRKELLFVVGLAGVVGIVVLVALIAELQKVPGSN